MGPVTPEAADRRKALSMLRDPMSKTMVVALFGMGCLTVLGIVVMLVPTLDPVVIGAVGTVVSGITGAIGMVASRAQGATQHGPRSTDSPP